MDAVPTEGTVSDVGDDKSGNLEQLKAALTACSIGFTEAASTQKIAGAVARTVIAIEHGIGYTGFTAEFYFDKNGKCLSRSWNLGAQSDEELKRNRLERMGGRDDG